MNPALMQLIEEIEKYRSTIDKRKVSVKAVPDEIRDHLGKRYDFKKPVPLQNLIKDVASIMGKWSVHTIHPRYFGYFNPTVRLASIAGDAMAALHNPNLAVWSHAPAANEIERAVLRFFTSEFGYNPDTSIAHFASGGAEANLTAVLAALTNAFPQYGEEGLISLNIQPLIYVSGEAHDSFTKICHITGIGRKALRKIKVDNNLKLDLGDLKKQISHDRREGYHPLLVNGTAGTTAAGIIDPLDELASFCREEKLWLHCDAAWGGAAVLSRKLKPHLKGIELADSITCDAHKWLSVSMAGAMFFCRHRAPVEKAFDVSTAYMPGSTPDIIEPYVTTVQWSRRFIGLKLFMALAETGSEGYERFIDHMAEMGVLLKNKLVEHGWIIVNKTPLPLACFTHGKIENGNVSFEEILEKIYSNGKVWISKVFLGKGIEALRACITSYNIQPEDIDILMDELNGALN